MNVRICALPMGVGVMLLVGCSSSGEVVRGQNPAGAGTEFTLASSHGDVSHFDSGCQLCQKMGSSCHECNRKNRLSRLKNMFKKRPLPRRTEAGRKHWPKDHPGEDWKPKHRHYYTYDAPQNLVYPPKNTPPAVVQYPYYTVKGPTDFFYK
ncbi:MAG: hypothetical protein ABGZ17_13990 [Planctomycetaceae bacterium]